MKKIISIFILLSMLLSTLCSCFAVKSSDNPEEQGGITDVGGGNVENNGNDQTGDNNGNDQTGDNNGGNTNKPPKEPDPDAGKNGIDEILLAFSELQVNDSEFEDSVVGATLKSYTFNKLDAENPENPVALYVINHGEERIGTDSDVSIIRTLIEEYVVVVLDYQNAENAKSVTLDESLHKIKLNMMNNGQFLEGIAYNVNQTYLIPAGCRIVRNIEFFNIMKSAPKGVEQKIIDVWNNQSQIKDKVGDAWVQADSLDDIVMKNGESLTAKDADGNYKYLSYHLDIIYPANAEVEVPVMMAASTGAIRNNSLSSTKTDRTQYVGFLFGGYAVCSLDHDYFPFMKDEAGWGHIEPNYTLQTYMGSRFLTAAVRCTKYYADEYGYSTEKYGIYGFSKSSWVALFKQASLANADPETLDEVYTYGGFAKGECFGEQPYKTYKNGQKIGSGVTCVYHGMGNGTNDCRDLDDSNIPQLVGVGEKCEYNSWTKFFDTKQVYNKMEQSGCNWVPLIMYDVNHTWPKNIEDELYGYNYYSAFMSFFAYHLKGEGAKLLHTSVKLDGFITEDEEIFLQFNAAVSLEGKIRLVAEGGNTVAGQWISARGGTQWKFVADEGALTVGESYKIILDTFTDARGATVEGTEAEFTYAEGERAPEILYNSSISGAIVADTYVMATSASDKNATGGSKTGLGTYADYYRAYFKFDFSAILASADYAAYKDSGKIQFTLTLSKGAGNVSSDTRINFGGFTPAEGIGSADFAAISWNSLLTGGAHEPLNWGKANTLLSGEHLGDKVSYYDGALTFTFDVSEIESLVDANGIAVFTLRIGGTSGISVASMENSSYDAPAVSFVYNK